MKDAQKPDHISLNTLVGRLRDGRFVIPDFQREFEWKPSDIRELMRSIFLDYYIGSLLLWKGKKENFEALSCEPVYGFQGDERPEYIVLDGQQRLTAMHYVFLSPDKPLPKRANRYVFYLRVDKFMRLEYDEAFEYDWLTRRWAKLISNREGQFNEHLFPLSIIGQEGWELANWVQGYCQYWSMREKETNDVTAKTHADNARAFGEHLRGITEQYQVSYIELDKDLEIDKICDIFTQINSRGEPLDTFDLINALLKPKGLRLKKMWRNVAPKLEFVDSPKMNVYILQVMSILLQGYCSPKYLYFLLPGQEKTVRDADGKRRKEVLVASTGDFERLWQKSVDGIEAAIKILRHPQEFGAISSNYLPYISIIPAFTALQAHIKALPPNRQLGAQRKVRHWYWASVFLNRYSGSVESTSARDFLDIKAWIADDESVPSLIEEFRTGFRNVDLRKEIKRGTSVYNGIFNLLVIQGAQDWMTGYVPQYGDLDDHHIIPASKAEELGAGSLIHSILNRTPLSSETNRNVIRSRYPNEYLPELIKQNGEQRVRAVLESHFISPTALAILLRDPFTNNDLEAFLAERQRTLLEAIENLLIKERLDLSPQLRELDQRVEAIEITLRGRIVEALGNESASLPPHVKQKMDERIQAAAKKSAAIDPEQYKKLDKGIEYLDLRELQDTILKPAWPKFQSQFANKETLATKFGQLADLRNGIRHSRSVDEITRKEGEAAILWFEQVLKR